VLNELAKIKDEKLFIPMPENGKWLGAGEIRRSGSALGDNFSIAFRTTDAQKCEASHFCANVKL